MPSFWSTKLGGRAPAAPATARASRGCPHQRLGSSVSGRLGGGHVDPPRPRRPTRAGRRRTPGSRRGRRRTLDRAPGRRAAGRGEEVGVVAAAGELRAHRVVETWRALALVGSTLASTRVKLMPRAGSATTTSTAAVAAATRPGRRITAREPVPEAASLSRASGSAAPAQRRGARALMRCRAPRARAGSTTARRRGDQCHEDAAEPHREQEALREDQQAGQRRGDGDRAEEHLAARRCASSRACASAPGPRRDLLAVARDDEQAVVDREAQAEAGHEVEGEDREGRWPR